MLEAAAGVCFAKASSHTPSSEFPAALKLFTLSNDCSM